MSKKSRTFHAKSEIRVSRDEFINSYADLKKGITTLKMICDRCGCTFSTIQALQSHKASKMCFSVNIELNAEQWKIVNAPLSDMKIVGNPGVGKTSTIIYRICKMYNDNRWNTGSFLVLMFTTNACEDFKTKGRKIIPIFNSNNVRTIHSLAATILNTFKKTNKNINTVVHWATQVLKNSKVEDIRDKIRQFKNLKDMYIDEAQDISKTQYDFIMTLKEKIHCCLSMIGDPNQNIFQFQGGTDRYLINYDAPLYSLTINNRSTPLLVKFANYFRPNTLFPAMTSSRVTSAESQVVVIHKDKEDIVSDIIDFIQNYSGDRQDIAIIGPMKKENTFGDTRLALSLIKNIMAYHNIEFVQHYSDSDADIEVKGKRNKKTTQCVNLHNIHTSKGEEFKIVFLLHFHLHTMGRPPTTDDYNKYHYYWWTALTRAKDCLYVCCMKGQKYWPVLEKVDSEHYHLQGEPLRSYSVELKENDVDSIHSVTTLIKQLTESEWIDIDRIHIDSQLLHDFGEMRIEYCDLVSKPLMGLYMENIFEYRYYEKHRSYSEYTDQLKKRFENQITVSKRFKYSFYHIQKLLGIGDSIVNRKIWMSFKDRWKNDNDKECYFEILKQFRNDKSHIILIENDVQYFNKNEIDKIIQMMENRQDIYWNIFQIVLYLYQIDTENKYQWAESYKNDIRLWIKSHIHDAVFHTFDRYCESLSPNFRFQEHNYNPFIDFFGRSDMQNEQTIIELKYKDSISFEDMFQLFCYYNNVCPRWDRKIDLILMNLKTGQEHKIVFDTDKQNIYTYLVWLSKTTHQKLRNMIIVYDLETTSKFPENSYIIERCVKELNLGFVISEGLIRSPVPLENDIIKLTGINEHMLQEEGDDSTDRFCQEMANFLSHTEKPKLVAHNGSRFDFPILLQHNIITDMYKIYSEDSRSLLRLYINKTLNENIKLENEKLLAFHEFFCPDHHILRQNCHRAAADVAMLIDIFRSIPHPYCTIY